MGDIRVHPKADGLHLFFEKIVRVWGNEGSLQLYNDQLKKIRMKFSFRQIMRI